MHFIIRPPFSSGPPPPTPSGTLWRYGNYLSPQSRVTGQRVAFNAVINNTLSAVLGVTNTTVPAGVTSADVWGQVRQDGTFGAAAATLFAQIELSTNGGGSWTAVTVGTANYVGGDNDTVIPIPMATIAVAAGNLLRIRSDFDPATPTSYGLVRYNNDSNMTFFRVNWYP